MARKRARGCEGVRGCAHLALLRRGGGDRHGVLPATDEQVGAVGERRDARLVRVRARVWVRVGVRVGVGVRVRVTVRVRARVRFILRCTWACLSGVRVDDMKLKGPAP